MSAEHLAERLTDRIAQQGRSIAHKEALPLLFEGFRTELLLKADDKAGGQVTGICAQSAIGACDHRMRKGMNLYDGAILISDFVSAFEYISDLCFAKNRIRFPAEHVKVFTQEISELVRKSCPWC